MTVTQESRLENAREDCGLPDHEAKVVRDLELLKLPPSNWAATVPGPDGQPLIDVLVVGAGMYGLAAAIALTFKGIRNLLVVDRNPSGREGPWTTFARMDTLRSPKDLPGPASGIPSLTFRAWYEARHGAIAWDGLYKIPNQVWQDYLGWLKRILRLPVRNGIEVASLAPARDFVTTTLADGRHLHARRVVLATGRSGAGGLYVPDNVAPDLWPDRAAHTNEKIDFARLAGRTVAVLGAGNSAWDNAACALEAGAKGVRMFARRKLLPQINKGRGSAHPGFFEGWAALSDPEKWSLLVYLDEAQAPPPHESVLRTLRHPGFAIGLGVTVKAARRGAQGVVLDLGERSAEAEFLIVATGLTVDLRREPLLTNLLPSITTWGDRYVPPPGLTRPHLARFPWLGPAFELVERHEGRCPGLERIHMFNHAAFASFGAIASDIPGVNYGAGRLASAMASQFFCADIRSIRASLEAFAEPELVDTPFFVPAAFPADERADRR
jgi:cation diffusion facilitator CzcD-associated flavoprotein CzcO